MRHRIAHRITAIVVPLVLSAASVLAQPRVTIDAGGEVAAHLRNTDAVGSSYLTAVEELSLYGVARHMPGLITMEYRLGVTGRRDSRRGYVEYAFAQNLLASVELTTATFRLTNREFPSSTGEFSFELGRRRFSDPTALIIDGIADRVSVVFEWPRVSASLDVAYTGLSSKNTDPIVLTDADRARLDDDSVYFAGPRLLSVATIGTPSIAARQDAEFFGAYHRDLETNGADIAFAGLRVDGPVVPHLFHTTSIAAGFTADDGVSLLSSLSLRYYLDRVNLSRIRVETTYASGDSGGLSRFIPVHRGRFGEKEIGFDAGFADRLVAELAYSFRPFIESNAAWLAATELGFDSVSFFRTTDAPAPEFPGNSTGPYLGTRVLAAARLRASSDFGLDARIGAFFPSNPDTDDHDRRRGFFSTSVFVLF
ncbi:MAG: hypothetical protein EA426_05460 [Spirochaetaceae bacterium]|nr:MAG: hypothetical protein EA426_05460 [Spirochaetaceae bacterium]